MCSDVSAGIDTSPGYSEAIIMFDAASMDIKVYNSVDGREAGYVVHPPDPNCSPSPNDEDEMGWELRQYTLTDSAGNSLVLNLNYKKEGKEVKVEVLCMQYNGGAIMEVPKNKMQAEFSIYGNGMLKKLEQKIKVKGLFEARAKFNARKNQTEICFPLNPNREIGEEICYPPSLALPPNPNRCIREIRTGLVILELLTNEGGFCISLMDTIEG